MVKITNIGETNAIVKMAFAGLHICNSDEMIGKGSGYKLLESHASVLKSWESQTNEVYWPGHLLEPFSATIADADSAERVHLHGTFGYADAFDDFWRIDFHYIWRNQGIGGLMFSHQRNLSGVWERQKNSKDAYRDVPEGWLKRKLKSIRKRLRPN